MGFQNLPNELLFVIAGQLHRSDLNALIQTCQLFYAVLNGILYLNNIRFNHSSALFWAATNGNCGTIQRMVAHGADLQIRAESAAVIRQGLDQLQIFNTKRRKESINARQTRSAARSLNFSACGETPLHRAAKLNQEAVVRYLLDSGYDMLSIDMNGYYPIQLAAHRGHESIVKVFLEKGFHPDTLSLASSDPSALHSAVCGGHCGIVKLLLDHSASSSVKTYAPYLALSPLDLALLSSWRTGSQGFENWQARFGTEHIRSGKEDCALLLIERCTEFEILEDNRYLVHAARENYARVVKVLLDLGIDPNMRLYGQNALAFAKRHRNQELVDILEPLTRSTAKKKGKKKNTEP